MHHPIAVPSKNDLIDNITALHGAVRLMEKKNDLEISLTWKHYNNVATRVLASTTVKATYIHSADHFFFPFRRGR